MIREIVAAVRRFCVKKAVRLSIFVVHCIPARLWFRIRDGAQIVGRLDYSRGDIDMVVDSWIEKDIRLHSVSKEPATVDWLEQWLKPGDVFYDVGANVGAYSLVALRFLAGNVRVYAFEPGFITFPQLCKNIHLNNAGEAIIPLQLALAERNSLIPFHYQNLITGGALHALAVPVDQDGEHFESLFSLPTLSFRLDDLVQQLGMAVPNHVKIDVDGSEYLVLQGARETLKKQQLRSLLLEYNPGHQGTNQIDTLLAECGLDLHRRQGENNLYVRKS
jgi:FkbM family methyltransferase